jgi:hypothetical protein
MHWRAKPDSSGFTISARLEPQPILSISNVYLKGSSKDTCGDEIAGIISAFQFKKEKQIPGGQVINLSMIANMSLMGAFFSVLPLALLNFGITERTVGAICSVFSCVAWIVYGVWYSAI